MNKPIKVSLPTQSKIESFASGAYFKDARSVPAAMPDLDPLEQFIRISHKTPSWINSLMVLRNRIVGLFGLKDLGAFADIDPAKPSADYAVGERVGIFTLVEKTENEVLLGDDDKHLNVVVSVHTTVEANQTIVTVSTVVHIKNWLGRLYMLPVAPAHHIIAQRMTKMIGDVS